MNNNRLEQNHIVAQSSKVLLVLLLPTLLLALLLCGLGQSTQASPVRQASCTLVPNPGFETPSPASWHNPGSSMTCGHRWSGSESHEGDHSAEIYGNQSGCVGDQGQWWCDFFAVQAGSQYTLCGWIKANGLSCRALCALAFYSSTSEGDVIGVFSSTQVTCPSDWTKVTTSTIIAPNGAQYARVYCKLIGVGTVWFDEIDVCEIKTTLAISKTDTPDPVKPGERLIYTITYGNTGNVTATQCVITEAYDKNVNFFDADPDPKPGSGNRVWEIVTLGPQRNGSIVVTVTVTRSLTNVRTLTNVVEMDCDETDPVSNTIPTTVIYPPDLDISKSGAPDPVNPGESLIYTITYSNTGNVAATHVVITETYDQNVSFSDADPDPKPDSGNRVWEVGTLGPQQGGFITVVVTVTRSLTNVRTLTNVVEMDCDETDPVSNTIPTTVTYLPDLDISKSAAPGPVKPGERLVYTITYSNTGNVTATHVVITETYDKNVSFFDADPNPKPGSGNRVWEVSTLGPQRGGSIAVVVTVTSSLANVRTLTNVVEMDCAENVTASYTETTVVSLIYLPIVLKNYPPIWHRSPLTNAVYSVAACPASPKDVVYAGTEGQGVYHSTTGGETWEFEDRMNGLAIMGLAVQSSDRQTAYAATWGGGVYKRSGTSWLPRNNGLGSCLHSNGAIVINPNEPHPLYVDIASELCTSNYGVFVSANGGELWSRANLANKNVGSLFIASKAPYTIYAGTDQGVFASTNGGAAWSELGDGLPEGKQVWAVIETPAGQVYAGTKDKGLYRLEGYQWKPVSINGSTEFTIYGLRYVQDSLYVATLDNGVYRLENSTWQYFNNGLEPLPAIYMMSSTNQRLYIATSSGVWWYPLP